MADDFPITPDLLREYVSECREILDGVDAGLLALESRPDDAETINDVMRGFHSVKGSSGFLRQTKIQTLSHAAEDVVSAARDTEAVLTADDIDVLLGVVDCLRRMLGEVEEGAADPSTDIGPHIQALQALPPQQKAFAPDGDPPEEVASTSGTPGAQVPSDVVEEFVDAAQETLRQTDALLVHLERNADDVGAVGEVVQHLSSLYESSQLLGLSRTARLAQTAKDVLMLCRDQGVEPNPDHIDALLVAVDYLRNLVTSLEQHQGIEPTIEIDGAVAMLRDAGGTILGSPSAAAQASPAPSVSEDLLRDYVTETREILGQLDTGLLVLESGEPEADTINDVFRGFHSIKGTSSFLQLHKMIALAHAAEDMLSRARDGHIVLTGDHVDTLLLSLDYLRALLTDIANGNLEPSLDIAGVVDVLRSMAAGAPSGVAKPAPPRVGEQAETVVLQPEGANADPPPARPAPPPQNGSGKQTGAGSDADATVRIDVRRLDAMLTLVGELLLARNRLSRTAGQAARALPDPALSELLTNDASYVSSLSEDLEAAMLRTRMLPVGRAFSRLPRIVRDAARATGKEVSLEVSGEETELDRALIEEIGDPLVHLVRNAVDHGLESPEERERAGKPRSGRLSLTAYHEGNRVVIAIQDDGGGIDAGRVRDRAVQRGIMPADAELTERETLDLIFQPGFSTRDEASDLSGRGVGLDVVRTNIQKLNGLIEVETSPGRGTAFLMKIPLTLAVVHVLVVGIGDEAYAVPTSAILEAIRLDDEQISMVEGRPFTMYGDKMLPLTHLRAFLGYGPEAWPKQPYMLMLASAERRAGLLVDRLLGQHEVIVKSLGRGLDESEGVGGAAVLDDGRVSIVLDVAAIVARVTKDQVGAAVVEPVR